MFEIFIRDLKQSERGLRKSPGFAVTAVALLGLGIGACVAMFSITNTVLLKPLPFVDPDRLVWIESSGKGGGLSERTSRADTVLAWQDENQTFTSLAGYFAFSDYGRTTLTGSGAPVALRGVSVSTNFLPTLGVNLLHGRNFSDAESVFRGPGAVILSHDFWRSRFAGDPAIVGQTLTLNGAPSAVIGVLPQTFDFDAIFTPGNQVDVLNVFPISPETAQWGNTLFGIGRLRPGVTISEAQAELQVISERQREITGNRAIGGAAIQPLDDVLRGRFRLAFRILAGAVACVLAIACMNLSGLLLSRVNARRSEFAMRLALGARPGHLVRQALTESLLLAALGSLIGLPLAVWATSALARLQTFGVPLLQNASVEPVAVIVTLGLIALAGLACGLFPALHLARESERRNPQDATHQRTASSATARNSLIVAQVAVACILLVGSGLLLRSFDSLMRVELGFEPGEALVFRVDAQRPLEDGASVQQYLGELTRRVAALPGVVDVGLSDTLPLGRNRNWGAGVSGVQYAAGERPSAHPRIVDPNYLRAMRIPLIKGRHFEEAFNPAADKAVIINESLAETLWPGLDPLGRRIDVNGGSTVIGVAATVRHRALEDAGGNEMYLDYRQTRDWGAMEMVVRSSRAPEPLAREIRSALTTYDPELPNGEFYVLERLIEDAVAPRRLIASLLSAFSSFALILAALGLYGVVAYSVAQRRQEIGIRMAIGARRGDVLRLVMGAAVRLVVVGTLAGLAGSLALTHGLKSQLFGVSAQDPLTFGGIAALLVVIAIAASLVPGWRATRIQPMVALRIE